MQAPSAADPALSGHRNALLPPIRQTVPCTHARRTPEFGVGSERQHLFDDREPGVIEVPADPHWPIGLRELGDQLRCGA